MERAIERALDKQWQEVAAELMVQKAAHCRSEFERRLYLEEAGRRFRQMGLDARALAILSGLKIQSDGTRSQDVSRQVVSDVKEKIDFRATLDLLASISELTDLETLGLELLESFSLCTGADHGAVYLCHQGSWQLLASQGISEERLRDGDYSGADFDVQFFRGKLEGDPQDYVIRKHGDHELARHCDLMLIPIRCDGTLEAAIYLGNRHMPDVFSKCQSQFVRALMHQSNIAFKNLTLMASRENAIRLAGEMETAKIVQDAFLTKRPLPSGIELASYYAPAEQTGGDWTGYFYDDRNQIVYLMIGDVTGHGMASAMMTGVICGAIYSSLLINGEMQELSGLSVGQRLVALAQSLNRSVHETGDPIGRVATMLFFGCDLCSGELAMVAAGHNHPYLIGGDGAIMTMSSPSPRIGAQPDSQFCAKTFWLNPGDVLFAYTDGLTENTGPTGLDFSKRRIREILSDSPRDGIIGTKERLVNGLKAVCQDHPPADDVAFFLFRWLGAAHGDD